VLGVVVLAAVAWIAGEHGLDELGYSNHHSDGWLFIHAVDSTPHYLAEMVGMFGANNIPAPPFATTMVAVSLALLVVGALAVGSWRQRLVLLALLVGIIAVPIVVDVVSGRHYGLIWQGRYTMAVGVGSPLFAGYVLAAWFERRRTGFGPAGGADGPAEVLSPSGVADGGAVRWLSWGRVSLLVFCVALLLAVGQFSSFLWDLRRFMVGADGRFSGVFGGVWHPPVDGFVLLIAAACGLLTITALLLWSPRTQRAPLR
jgi:hypothetical protein